MTKERVEGSQTLFKGRAGKVGVQLQPKTLAKSPGDGDVLCEGKAGWAVEFSLAQGRAGAPSRAEAFAMGRPSRSLEIQGLALACGHGEGGKLSCFASPRSSQRGWSGGAGRAGGLRSSLQIILQ
jgi:hypothetical protein